jgi:hypothetical protein
MRQVRCASFPAPLPHPWEALEVEGLPVLYRMGEQGEQTAPVCCRKKRVSLDEAHSRRKRDLNSGFRIFQQAALLKGA